MIRSGIQQILAKWRAPAHVRALTTFRTGGVSAGTFKSFNLATHLGDNPSAVKQNRQRLVEHYKLPSEPAWLQQVHGQNVVSVTTGHRELLADGSFTRERGIVCVVLTADCIPLFLTDLAGSFVSLLHLGWRGLAYDLIESGLTALSVNPIELLAWIGPGIGPDSFIVGDEVQQRLVRQMPEHAKACSRYGNKWRADLPLMVEQRLRACGVREISHSRICTGTDSQAWFSHRREGHCGRMASLIWLA